MADTSTLPTVTAEVTTPQLHLVESLPMATSLQIAENFGKRHTDVLRAIRNLLESIGPQGARNFARTLVETTMTGAPRIAGAKRNDPAYLITRDGFALLSMGFTGKDALRWKLAYITAFNAMEAKLRSLYIEPLVNDKQFRMGIPMHLKFRLQEQSRRTMRELLTETAPAARRNMYWQLRQINDALGIPTESMAALGIMTLALEGAAA
ncbi:MAG: Rha family transcriptional regulator [Burkholderiales bacterium]|nr:Rha family transcriptional regulator [Burkholderiales bacterium]